MVIPKHYRVRFSGDILNGPSTWSIGHTFRSGTGGDPGGIDDASGQLSHWRDAIRALNGGQVFPDAIRGVMSAAVRLTAIRCSQIGEDGKEEAVSLVEGAPLAQGTGTLQMPTQVAMAVTLRTGRPGASYRGRVYLPALHPGIGVGGRLAMEDLQIISTQYAGFLRGLETAGADIGHPQKQASVISTAKGVATQISTIAIGDRLDIQRRRADKQDETYAVSVIPE